MSRSQFYSIKLFILRHAWLNLWDKHMTTGRINQVTLLSDLPLRRTEPLRNAPDCNTHSRKTHTRSKSTASCTPLPWREECWQNKKFKTRKSDSLVLSSVSTAYHHRTKQQRDEESRGFPKEHTWCRQSTAHLSSNPEGRAKRTETDLQKFELICLPIGYAYKLFHSQQ